MEENILFRKHEIFPPVHKMNPYDWQLQIFTMLIVLEIKVLLEHFFLDFEYDVFSRTPCV